MAGPPAQSTFFARKPVLVTGHTGFKGGCLSLWLHQLGASVSGVALAPGEPSLFEVLDAKQWLANSSYTNICDLDELRSVFTEANPEVIFHLAAQPIVRQSYADPVENFSTNVMGTVNVLEAARACPQLRSFVVVTSDKCYENRERIEPYSEGDHLGGSDPYSASKACAEIVTSSYRRSFYSPVKGSPVGLATVRAGNVIGGGDWADGRLVPDIVRAAMNGGEISLRYPKSVRPWQHVLEPLSGYLQLAEKLWNEPAAFSAAWNFGPAKESHCEVQWLVEEFRKHLPKPPACTIDSGEHPPEHRELRLDSSRAQRDLGWGPRLNIMQAVEMTASWYETYLRAPESIAGYTLEQLRQYEKLSPQKG